MSAAERQPETAQPHGGGLRYLAESLVSLAIAVLLVRSFVVEGYIISTGSMAPFLLGFHKQVVCPSCRYPFAVGVPVDDAQDTSGPVSCPNCGQDHIDLSQVPRNEGDQLLVQKFAYLFRRPKRWEVVVFQNPHQPTQAYVKRVIGLPGEEVQIRAGDVWINGELARKNLAEQRSTRIPICVQQHRPDSESQCRWHTDERWVPRGSGFELKSRDESEWSWVRYRTASDSTSRSEPRDLSQWPTDEYAYNGLTGRVPRYRVRDLMLAMHVELHSGRGEFVWSLSDGQQTYDVHLAAGDRALRLFVNGIEQPEEEVQLAGSVWRRPRLVEVSLFDRQLLFALDGQTIVCRPLDPVLAGVKNGGIAANSATEGIGGPVRFGARDLHVSVSDLTLYRDVYYTRGEGGNGIAEPYRLGDDEYFFLGDNSPVSLDSRGWNDAVVRDHMLIGKPFLVHLPSRPGRIRLGSAEWHIRVPDWRRIRYIR